MTRPGLGPVPSDFCAEPGRFWTHACIRPLFSCRTRALEKVFTVRCAGPDQLRPADFPGDRLAHLTAVIDRRARSVLPPDRHHLGCTVGSRGGRAGDSGDHCCVVLVHVASRRSMRPSRRSRVSPPGWARGTPATSRGGTGSYAATWCDTSPNFPRRNGTYAANVGRNGPGHPRYRGRRREARVSRRRRRGTRLVRCARGS
jgi:hypothetical protein